MTADRVRGASHTQTETVPYVRVTKLGKDTTQDSGYLSHRLASGMSADTKGSGTWVSQLSIIDRRSLAELKGSSQRCLVVDGLQSRMSDAQGISE